MISKGRLAWVAVFAVTMAFLESAVVVYLREIFYPDGFSFPIVLIPEALGAIEIGREASTMVMLLAVAFLAGKDRWERFLVFSLAFGIWDIFYYVWLWVFLRWPPSLLTWDILFLVPVPWIGPVLAPLIISVCLVGGSMVLMFCRARGHKLRFPLWHWGLAVVGGLVVLLSFTWDWRTVLEGRMPPPFRWWSFGTGVGIGLVAFALGLRSISSSLSKRSSTH